MRDSFVQDVTELLRKGGFRVSDRCNIRPKSFDIVARREPVVVLVKILSNIDGFDAETAREMKVVSHHLGAKSLIIGKKSRDEKLEDGVVYLRYGIPAVNLQTAHDYFIEGVPPLVYMGPGGLYVNLDGDVLSEVRQEEDVSLGQVANEIGVSRRSISKYEDGMDATVDIAIKLEEFFDEALVSPLNIFKMEENQEEKEGREEREVSKEELNQEEFTVLKTLDTAGLDVLPTSKAPFRALSQTEEDDDEKEKKVKEIRRETTFLTGVSDYSESMVKRAKIMSSISKVAKTESIYIVGGESKKESIDDTVIIEFDELEDMNDFEELLEDIREKKAT